MPSVPNMSKILSHDPGFDGVPQDRDWWEDTLEDLKIYSMAFAYLNLAPVSKIFLDTQYRMRKFLQRLDTLASLYGAPRCAPVLP